MGMFDWIKNFEIECPNCKNKVNDFQSKDGRCLLNNIGFWEVNNFYSNCSKCKAWIEFSLDGRQNRKIDISNYELKVNGVIVKDGNAVEGGQ